MIYLEVVVAVVGDDGVAVVDAESFLGVFESQYATRKRDAEEEDEVGLLVALCP